MSLEQKGGLMKRCGYLNLRWAVTWLVASLLVGSMSAGQADVILEGTDASLSGTVGLEGETSASGNVTVYWNGGNNQIALTSSSSAYSIGAKSGNTLGLYSYQYGFQNTSSAYLQYNRWNIPALAADENRVLNLRRASGRIRGSVTVNGGTLTYLALQASVNNSSVPESATAWVSASGSNSLELPMFAQSNVQVSGSATISSDAGCNVPVSLSTKTVSVGSGAITDVSWSFDVTAEQCATGAIQGNVTTGGLSGENSDVRLSNHYIYASGPEFKSASIPADGNYLISALRAGSYSVYGYSYFQAPYGYLYRPGASSQSVSNGQTTNANLAANVGTLHLHLLLDGLWDSSNTSFLYGQLYNTAGGSSFDSVAPGADQLDLVVGSGVNYLGNTYFQFQAQDNNYTGYQSLYQYFYNDSLSPVRRVVATGDRLAVEHEISTAEAPQTFYIAKPDVSIGRLTISGSMATTTSSGQVSGYTSIYHSVSARSGGVPQNDLSVLLRGIPGTYQMLAQAQGTDGGLYSAPFTLTLGEPFNTPVGSDISQDMTGDAGAAIGSVTFGTVSAPGETSVSYSDIGPADKPNFKVFSGAFKKYYDVRTTAEFDQATICIDYDDAGLSAGGEQRLELSHYVCADAPANTQCEWENITSEGYPDVAANRICGVTDSFSIFAILEPIDSDEDGVTDTLDNCPSTVNADQADLDGDGVGNACETDTDGDGLVDDEDRCPLMVGSNNDDLDADGLGDICDNDVDGDQLDNAVDNCPLFANAGQVDYDADGSGDDCDLDDDGDQVEDIADFCQGTDSSAAIDTQGCSSPQRFVRACPVSATYKTHGQYVSCVANEADKQVAIGLITEEEKGAIVSGTAKTKTGK
jgi:Thrombospondin type 3 repeat